MKPMTTPFQERKMGDTHPNPGDMAYFEAAAAGRLMLKHCASCAAVHHYPRALCPFCWSEALTWVQAKGTAEIYTFSVCRRVGPVPYCIAYVKLDEGPTMMTNIVDCDLDTIRIGQRVRVTFRTTEGGVSMPVFAPA
jgi:uncharacterized OB-fold protein